MDNPNPNSAGKQSDANKQPAAPGSRHLSAPNTNVGSLDEAANRYLHGRLSLEELESIIEASEPSTGEHVAALAQRRQYIRRFVK